MKTRRPVEAEAEFRKAFAIMEESRASSEDRSQDLVLLEPRPVLRRLRGLPGEWRQTRGRLEVADRSRARQLRELLEIDASCRWPRPPIPGNGAGLDAVILFYWLAPKRSFRGQ
jgi:hypothetical protein